MTITPLPRSTSPDVFLSYARTDATVAGEIRSALELEGIVVWQDKSRIENGDHFPTEIIDGIFKAAGTLVLWSETSAQSAWVRDEALLGYALNRLHPVFLERGVEKFLEPRYREIDAAGYYGDLNADAQAASIKGLVKAIADTRDRTPPFLRRRPPAKAEREHGLSQFLHAVLNAKFCFEAYGGDPERSVSTRFLPAIERLKRWPNSDVVDAVLRFGEGASPGEALWALYMAAEKLDLPELWTTVGRAIRPFSLLMSVACFERAGVVADAIENEFYPVSVDNLIKERRGAVPRPPPIAAASPPATAEPTTVLLAESHRPVRMKPQANPKPEDSLGQPDAPTPGVQRRNRALKMIGAIAVVVILVGGVWTWNQHQGQKAPLAPSVGRVLETPGAITPFTPAYCSKTGGSLSCRLESGRTLWDIAVECYGDGERSRELWRINHDRFPGRTVRQIPDDSAIEMVGACTARAS